MILNKVYALLMLISVFGTTFSKVVVQLDYSINQKYIAAALCENRNKPKCCCHGKCFLKKQLQKDEGNDKNRPSNTKEKFEVSLFCETTTQKDTTEINIKNNFRENYLLKKSSPLISPVFHPPGVAQGI
ncbi:MAG TPA: hypothetical protein VMT76_04930 [Puia sp.]|nr:hypothetical protein [Puia sp.]